jgi:hypothetical protein
MEITEIKVRSGPKEAGLFLTLRDIKLHGLKDAILLKSE